MPERANSSPTQVKRFREITFKITTHGFGYKANIINFELCPPPLPELASQYWAIACHPTNHIDELKKCLELFYTTVGWVHKNTIKAPGSPPADASTSAAVPDSMDIDVPAVLDDGYPPPHDINIKRPNLRDHRTGFLMKNSPAGDGNPDVILDGYKPHQCPLCGVNVDEYSFKRIEEWRNTCKKCPAYETDENDPDRDTTRCVACVLGMRTRRLDLGFETHPRDAFPTPLTWPHQGSVTISGFVRAAIEIVGMDLFVVASTVTIVALWIEYVRAQCGGDNLHECEHGLDQVCIPSPLFLTLC